MNTILILIGVGCIIGAIIGGGVKLVQIELSPVASLWRQLLLGLFGIILVVSGIVAGKAPGPAQSGPAPSGTQGNPSSAAAPGTGVNTPAAGQQANAQDYILPDSQDRRLTADDLANLSLAQLRIARNEIYARHGHRFKSADLADYFSKKSWYQPSADESPLSPIEQANIELIGQYEKSRG